MRLSARYLLLTTAIALAMTAGRGAIARDGFEHDGDGDALRILSPVTIHYDGSTDDLLTAGLGKSGLAGTTPTLVDPLHPTAAELRRLAIYTNYRALVDMSAAGGYGTYWGPNVTADGTVTASQGLIPGDETLAYALQPDGSRVTLMIQVPDSFDPRHACIVTGPSSGSRGVYGAIATAGEWGLKHGCAVAYTDKGSGTGFDDLQNGEVTLLQGQVVPIATAGRNSQFTARLSAHERAAFDAAYPSRFAFKHAHSQVNPEKDWGSYVLQSIRYAFQVLNAKYPGAGISKRNTIVIASSVSNGGGASIRAAEEDRNGLIDGVAVGEPNVNPVSARFSIQQGSQPRFNRHSRPLIDYVTLQNIYVGCAVNGPSIIVPFNLAAPSPGRCMALKNAGLLTGTTLAEQATQAQAILNHFGIMPEQNPLEGVIWYSYVPQSISVTYANAYGRFSVADALCGYSFAAVTAAGTPTKLSDPAEAILFATSNGIPPTGGVALINNVANLEDRLSTTDQDLRGALCLRSLATGSDATTGAALSATQKRQARRIEEGVEEILATGQLHRKPTLIVTGRADDILPPNFTSRGYVGLNALQEGGESRVRYIEVKNAQHLDSILSLPGISSSYVPLHRYFIEAMDRMYAHFRNGQALPPSQVMQTVPRGAGAPALTDVNVPPISDSPGTNQIIFTNRVLYIPE